MALMTTCLGRLGSRYSMILDPVRREFHYGALGMKSQAVGELVIGLDDGRGTFETLPLCKSTQTFTMVDQYQTMTSLVYEAFSERHGAAFEVELTSPFWPQDEQTSLVPAYLITLRLKKLVRIRARLCEQAQRYGILKIGLNVGQKNGTSDGECYCFEYPVHIFERAAASDDGFAVRKAGNERTIKSNGYSFDRLVPLEGNWRCGQNGLEADFDLVESEEQVFRAALICHCNDALFERRGKGLKLKYTRYWASVQEVSDYVQSHWRQLFEKSVAFDRLIADSPLPPGAQKIMSYSFQNYLMNTLWAVDVNGRDWFSVWEGNCIYNSTIDVTFNEALFYFSCWPELMELIFSEWAEHANDAAAERRRLENVPKNYAIKSLDDAELAFDGKILEHDMGSGWTANGQSYPHAMPVEENSNFLILLYAHGCWWGRSDLFERYGDLCKDLVAYLLWADSTGTGFADRGRANTFDDGSPAVQYGKDNVYLGVKRMAALHCAMRMFTTAGQTDLADRCRQEVQKAIRSLHNAFLGDHFAVVLDRSAKGLLHCITGEPLEFDELPGWNDYSIFTANGLLYLMMIDDLPEGLDLDLVKQDIMNATAATMTRFGSSHSGKDNYRSVWISANLWRDCLAGYLGENMLSLSERYWDLQLFSNSMGSDNANCFTECAANNCLILYPRGVAAFGLLLSATNLRINRIQNKSVSESSAIGQWPVLPLTDWKTPSTSRKSSLNNILNTLKQVYQR